jgi:DNA-binding XRE family transcriptional regulator
MEGWPTNWTEFYTLRGYGIPAIMREVQRPLGNARCRFQHVGRAQIRSFAGKGLDIVVRYRVYACDMESLTRGQLARLAHVNPETIRFYEREGILPRPTRARNGYRSYSVAAVERIQFVGRAKSLGFSLEQIRDLLKMQEAVGPVARQK